ncbi:16S rRNA (guanine(527)-N(7))-methyltransferase RsmG [Mycoplasmopsis primatum]|uniref:16S rRNA (guanine(527)-N(7))-methyltransferase RsmG n=1 Tax=Mycoplasmopsis primatum TaxID=55604 RepID=UPI000495E759|nr:16S rRNA (guanine(527)-N(7))-methyltransferase RsmG [Mycoplasmopsis primatum]
MLNNDKDYILTKYQKQLPALKKYAQMIYEQNKIMNITGFKTLEDIFNQGILGSLLFFEQTIKNWNLNFENKKIIDIGSGAGFPSVPFLIANNNQFNLIIIESITKRCAFLQTIKEEFNLNISIINDRAENVILNLESNFITARALGSAVSIYLMSNHLLAKNGCFILPKGKKYKDEVLKFKDKFELESNNISCYEYYDSINNEESSIIKIDKIKPTPRGWPWSWSKIKNY